MGEIFAHCTPDKGISKAHKVLTELNNKIFNNPIQNRKEEMNRLVWFSLLENSMVTSQKS